MVSKFESIIQNLPTLIVPSKNDGKIDYSLIPIKRSVVLNVVLRLSFKNFY